MISTLKRGLAAAALTSLLALGTASAANATFTVTNGGSFAATAASSRLVINSAIPLNCTTTTGSGSIATGTYAVGATAGTIIPVFSSCIGPSSLPFNVRCNSAGTPAPTSTSPASIQFTSTSTPSANTTTGDIENISCVVYFSATCYAHVTGTVPVIYSNPGHVNANGRLTVELAGQNLVVSGSTCTNLIPNGTATYGGTGTGTLGQTNLDYNLNAVGPTIV